MTRPSTSAIERALEQIKSVRRATDTISAAERTATQLGHAARYADLSTYDAAQILAARSSLRAAEEAASLGRYVPNPYDAAFSDPYAGSSIKQAMEELNRDHRVALPDPHLNAGIRSGVESPIAAATRKAMEAAKLSYPGTYENPDVEILRRRAEAAGLSPRGAVAYARDEMRRLGNLDAHGYYADLDITPRLASSVDYEPASAYGVSYPRPLPSAPTTAPTYPRPSGDAFRSIATHHKGELKGSRRVKRGRPAFLPAPDQSPTPFESVEVLGERLRARRLELGLSQQEFADLAGVGRRFVSELESGKDSVEMGRVIKVCRAAGLPLMSR